MELASKNERADVATTSIDIEADPAQVWRAMTDPIGLEQWMGSGAAIGAEAGAIIDLPDPTTGVHRRGWVNTIESHRLLEYTWWSDDEPNDLSRVSISLVPTAQGTRVIVHEQPLGRRTSPALASTIGRTSTAVAVGGCSPTTRDRRLGIAKAWAARLSILARAHSTVCVGAGLPV